MQHGTFLRELERVAHAVEEDLAQPDFVEHQAAGQGGIDFHAQLHVLLRGFLGKNLLDLAQDRADRNVLVFEVQLAGLDLGKVEDVVDELEQRAAAGMDGGQITLCLGFAHQAGQQFGKAQDGVHGRADFVAHVRQKFRLGAVGRFRRGDRLPEFLPRLLFRR